MYIILLVGQQERHLGSKKTKWSGAGVVICLERDADLHMPQLMLLPLNVCCFSKIQTGFTFVVLALRLTWVVPEKGLSNMSVCVYCIQIGLSLIHI